MTVMNRIRLYGALLALLVVLFILGSIFGPRRVKPLGPVFPGLTTDAVEEIAIGSGDDAVSLRRESGAWVIDEGSRQYPARSDRITSFVDEAAASRLVRRITANENLWPDFDLAAEQGTRLAFSVGDETGRKPEAVVWGADSSEPGLAYLRRGEEPDVYASDGQLGFYLRQPVSYWSYLRLLPEDVVPSEVISVSSTIDTELGEEEKLSVDYELTRTITRDSGSGSGEESWVTESADGTLDATAVNRLLRDVVDLVGRDFHREPLSQLSSSVGSIRLAFSSGREYLIRVHRTDGGFVCTAEGESLPGDAFGGLGYEVSEATLRRLFPEVSALMVE